MVDYVHISAGIRVGFWNPSPKWGNTPFDCVGIYTGPSLGDQLPGWRGEQELIEGTVKFRVGVLFRSDLGRKQRLETILILESYIPEMFEYEDWDSATG